ncbi:HVA22 a [Olea europaea subsp. europaea]|uniref:HVA22 a n=1 Tax=Olea europaea subsp. europaea TaxID=158383 RepID=A0A8S0S9U5_OLEEU|nr:HVA22 a [Olea europaea subsp. europaea]
MPRFDGACYVYQRLVNTCWNVNLRALVSRLCRPNEDQSLTTETLVAVTERYVKENGLEAFENLTKSKGRKHSTNIQNLFDSYVIKGVISEEIKNQLARPSWPMFALGYPICASIRAIETGSKYHMRKLVIYWTLFALIYLFEFAFIKLIEWIPLWSFIKFIAICWLVLPQFDGACYVYQRLVNPCLYVNLRALVGRLCRPNDEQSLTTETLVAVTERYIKENGSEAFENLMKSKLKCIEPDNVPKDIKQLESRDKIDAETQEQPKCEEPEVAQKDINALEPTEKISSTTGEQVRFLVMCIFETTVFKKVGSLVSLRIHIQHADAKIPEANERNLELPVKQVQQEWACALCQVTTTSEKDLNSHLEGNQHKSKCEALKGSKQDTKSRGSLPSTTHKSTDRQTQEQTNLNGAGSNQTPELWCHICKVKLLNKIYLASHLRGRKNSTNIPKMFDTYVIKGVISEEIKNQLKWPMFALGYPLCASVRAIESGSKYHMRKLVIYWTLFSLISLFELAFIKLIEWIPLWSFIKFIAICWLVLPQFDGACYVYQRLVNPCSYVNLRALVGWLCRPNEEQSLRTETLVAATERYIKENGSEAFENLMKSKIGNTLHVSLSKDIEQLESRDKIDADTQEQPKCEEPEVAQKDINVLEPTEKIPSTPEEPHADAKIAEKIVREEAHERLPEVPEKKVQREWACALCQVTTTSEKTLNSHLQGSKHKSKCDELKRSKQDTKSRGSSPSVTHKSKSGNLEPEKGNIGEGSKKNLNRKTEETVQPRAKSDRKTQEQTTPYDAGSNKTDKLWCHLCKVKMPGETQLADHLRGKKHASKIQNMSPYGAGSNTTDKLWCHICKVKMPGETQLADHLRGKKHASKIQKMSNGDV